MIEYTVYIEGVRAGVVRSDRPLDDERILELANVDKERYYDEILEHGDRDTYIMQIC